MTGGIFLYMKPYKNDEIFFAISQLCLYTYSLNSLEKKNLKKKYLYEKYLKKTFSHVCPVKCPLNLPLNLSVNFLVNLRQNSSVVLS